MARVKVTDANGKSRMLSDRLANDPAYMKAQGLVKQEVKKPATKRKATTSKTKAK